MMNDGSDNRCADNGGFGGGLPASHRREQPKIHAAGAVRQPKTHRIQDRQALGAG